ncbi:Protein of unknown function, DUF481 [Zhouia amylolytica]|uniref:Salt-induced outer membrane protein YdiY n=1 Tax=Zhouia amylolytica TaxID=376730 RepID=A0A1I6PJN7_9FLAO|nr:DUF481 domain-containing protein [Zhouia amylolytica]SFS40414.1 Protein of unknown function, DUF481 [Zhouia amylolytica]
MKFYQPNKGAFKLIYVFLCLFFFKAHGQNDTITLKNQDRLIGEIKQMSKGVLTIETDYSDDDFKVTWVEIQQIISTQDFLVTLKDGRRIKASQISHKDSSDEIILKEEDNNITTINVEDIVFIRSVKKDFISRLDASLSFGFNFTKSKNLKQLTVRSTLGYTANFWSVEGSYNSVRSNQDDSDEIHRTDAYVAFNYFLKKDRFILFSSEFLANTEQQLDLRLTHKLGFGKYFVHTNQMYLGTGGGIAYNNENYFNDADDRKSAELFGMVEVNMFDFENISLLSNLTVYPSLTESGRWRTDFKVDLKYDLPLEFFIKLGITYNYDNQPVQGSAYDDYILQTTFGWEL